MSLSKKQGQIKKLLREGKTNQEIAKSVKESIGTINAYIANLTRK